MASEYACICATTNPIKFGRLWAFHGSSAEEISALFASVANRNAGGPRSSEKRALAREINAAFTSRGADFVGEAGIDGGSTPPGDEVVTRASQRGGGAFGFCRYLRSGKVHGGAPFNIALPPIDEDWKCRGDSACFAKRGSAGVSTGRA